MAFLSDELESLYKEWMTGGPGTNVSKQFRTFIAHKFKEANITNTKGVVDNVIYINGIVNRSSFVKNSHLPQNVVVKIVLYSLPEEMATLSYNCSLTLKEKLEELLIK